MKRLRRKALSLTAVLSMLAMPLALAVPAAKAAPSGYPTTESAHWAGYWAHRLDNGPYTHVEAGWVQPSITQVRLDSASPYVTGIWIGIGGTHTDDATKPPVQVGTVMETSPTDNILQTNYKAFLEYPGSPPFNGTTPQYISGFTVRPGDEMLAGVDYSNGSFSVFLADRTSGSNWSSPPIQDHNYPRDDAEVIVEWPPGTAGLVPFKTVDFKYVDLG